jgi:hypothetical protein
VILYVLKELPPDRKNRLVPFFAGSSGYTLILLTI